MEERVKLPSIFLMIYAALKLAFALLSLAMNALSMAGVTVLSFFPQQHNQGELDQQSQMILNMFSGGIGIATALFSLIVAATILFGAYKMSKLENHTFAIVACALACLPCDCCCLIGLPLGVWGIVTLMDAQVKESFR